MLGGVRAPIGKLRITLLVSVIISSGFFDTGREGVETVKILVMAALSIAVIATGCATRQDATGNESTIKTAPRGAAKEHKLSIRSEHPSVGLNEYVLITDDLERDKAEADAVIQAKIGLPYAMQTKDRKDFEAVLARNLIFRGEDEFFDREGYIANRVGDPSKVKSADYRNVVVQFITPERALVTYSNIVEDQPGGPGAWKADMSWADVLVKEDGKWKYEIVHTIAYKDLTASKQ